ncbi:MAG: ABC transporter ATP-binding protein [Vicinamibacterales bacterium]
MNDGVVSLARWTLSFVHPYRRRVAFIFVLSIVEIALVSLAPWPLKVVVDNVLGGQPLPPSIAAPIEPLTGSSPVALLFLIVAAGLFLQLTSELVRMVQTQVQVDTGQRMVYSLRATLLSHMQALALRHHVSSSTADSAYRLETDAYCVHDLVMDGLFPLVTAVLTLGVMFAVLLRLDATLALLSLVVIPFLYAALGYYSRRMVDRAEGVKELESKLLDRVFEILGSIKVVKSFARERHELDRFSRAGDDTMRARLRLTWQESVFSVVVTAITLGGTALVLAVGGVHVLRGELSVGSLLVVIAYLAAVYNPLSSIAHTTGSLQNALASARRVRAVLGLPREGLDRADAVDAVALAGDVRFEDVGFAYDEGRPILDGISFSARPGEMVALVGLTGAGKTTVASLIPRFYEPTRGRITIDGVDVARYRIGSLREQVALVLQEPTLFGGTIADNIRYGRLDATEAEVEHAARAAHAHDFIARLPKGYQTTVAEAGGSLSGGERQRLSIARAVLKNAPILILDEPTSSLDALSEEAVFEALRRLRVGRTTIVIAHRLSTIRDADRILVLHDGRILAQGTHGELLAENELYRRMCARLSVGRSLDEPETVDELIRAIG